MYHVIHTSTYYHIASMFVSVLCTDNSFACVDDFITVRFLMLEEKLLQV